MVFCVYNMSTLKRFESAGWVGKIIQAYYFYWISWISCNENHDKRKVGSLMASYGSVGSGFIYFIVKQPTLQVRLWLTDWLMQYVYRQDNFLNFLFMFDHVCQLSFLHSDSCFTSLPWMKWQITMSLNISENIWHNVSTLRNKQNTHNVMAHCLLLGCPHCPPVGCPSWLSWLVGLPRMSVQIWKGGRTGGRRVERMSFWELSWEEVTPLSLPS